jgi:hypothetical protein
MGVESAGRKALFEKGSVSGNGALVLILVAMRGGEVGAVQGTIYRDFSVRAATYGADFFALGWAKASRFSFFTNRTRQKISPVLAGGKNTVHFAKNKIGASG